LVLEIRRDDERGRGAGEQYSLLASYSFSRPSSPSIEVEPLERAHRDDAWSFVLRHIISSLISSFYPHPLPSSNAQTASLKKFISTSDI